MFAVTDWYWEYKPLRVRGFKDYPVFRSLMDILNPFANFRLDRHRAFHGLVKSGNGVVPEF